MIQRFSLLKTTRPSYRLVLSVLIVAIGAGLFAAHHMDREGHWVTGMNNQIVWGVPHVFAILLILAASGVLNVASLGSVFGKTLYAPWSRFSGLQSICFLVGGLSILVLDLGRPERLIVAMTYYNLKSIFAWNVVLYVGFIGVVTVYLWTLFERNMKQYSRQVGLFAMGWRFVLTGGTGSIFGFLVARELYDSAMMVPMFIVLSLVVGSALFMLISVVIAHWSDIEFAPSYLARLNSLLSLFIVLELFLVAVFHLTGLYAAEHQGVETFILWGGSFYTFLFWGGQVIAGSLIPLVLIWFTTTSQTVKGTVCIALLAVIGAVAQLVVLILGGQVYPLDLFPGHDVSSAFFDGVIAHYVPALPEFLLGLGGMALSLLLVIVTMRVLPFLPVMPADSVKQAMRAAKR